MIEQSGYLRRFEAAEFLRCRVLIDTADLLKYLESTKK